MTPSKNLRTRWSNEDARALMQMVRSGMDFVKIAQNLGRSVGATSVKYQALLIAQRNAEHQRMLPKMLRAGLPWTPEGNAALIETFRSGAPLHDVIRFSGRTANGALTQLKRLGLLVEADGDYYARYQDSNDLKFLVGRADVHRLEVQAYGLDLQEQPPSSSIAPAESSDAPLARERAK